jgi:peptidylprolyl isomerase
MLKTILFSLIPFTGYVNELDVAKISEAMGHIIGKNLQELGVDLDIDAIVKGLKEEAEGKSSPLNDEECVQAIAELQDKTLAQASEQILEQADSLSNGDQVHEDPPFSAPDTPKYR